MQPLPTVLVRAVSLGAVAVALSSLLVAHKRTGNPPVFAEAWVVEGTQDNAWFGRSIANAGDVNGDGYSDVIVGSGNYTGDQINEGRADLWLGSASGLAAAPAWTVEGDALSAFLGSSVAGAGDFNGDGFDDVIVGARGLKNGLQLNGGARCYLGSAAGLSLTPAWTVLGTVPGGKFGTAVAFAGDVNADGFSDVIIGAPGVNDGISDRGRAYLFLGSDVGIGPSVWTGKTDEGGANVPSNYGLAVASAGDVNGDGFDDVLVGAPNLPYTLPNEGMAFLYLGSASGLATTASWGVAGQQAGSVFGTSVAGAGDVDDDGFDDVIIGAPENGVWGNNYGRALLFHGSPAGLLVQPGTILAPSYPNGELGTSVAGAGDVNGDGFDDVVVGAPRFTNLQTREGRIRVHFGSEDGLNENAAWSAELNKVLAGLGTAVAGAGDVNGDGFADVLAGAPWYDNPVPFPGSEGRAYAWYGAEMTASTTYCAAGASAQPCFAHLDTLGIASASASSGFSLLATHVQAQKDGIFFFGVNGRQALAWGNGTSLQCVAPPVSRAGLLSGNSMAIGCNGSFEQDLNALWCPTCPKPQKNPGAGTMVQAQLWYRDPANTSNQTTSLSEATEFVVAP